MAWEQLETHPVAMTKSKQSLLIWQDRTSQHLILLSAHLSLLCGANSLIYAFIQLPHAPGHQPLVLKYHLLERCWVLSWRLPRSREVCPQVNCRTLEGKALAKVTYYLAGKLSIMSWPPGYQSGRPVSNLWCYSFVQKLKCYSATSGAGLRKTSAINPAHGTMLERSRAIHFTQLWVGKFSNSSLLYKKPKESEGIWGVWRKELLVPATQM